MALTPFLASFREVLPPVSADGIFLRGSKKALAKYAAKDTWANYAQQLRHKTDGFSRHFGVHFVSYDARPGMPNAVHSRFWMYDGIAQAGCWRLVLMLDVTDIIFQLNPFPLLPDAPMAYVIEEPWKVLNGGAYHKPAMECLAGSGKKVWEHVDGTLPPINAGHLAVSGTAGLVRSIFDWIANRTEAMLAGCPAVARSPQYSMHRFWDQAAINFLIYSKHMDYSLARFAVDRPARLCGRMSSMIAMKFGSWQAAGSGAPRSTRAARIIRFRVRFLSQQKPAPAPSEIGRWHLRCSRTDLTSPQRSSTTGTRTCYRRGSQLRRGTPCLRPSRSTQASIPSLRTGWGSKCDSATL